MSRASGNTTHGPGAPPTAALGISYGEDPDTSRDGRVVPACGTCPRIHAIDADFEEILAERLGW